MPFPDFWSNPNVNTGSGGVKSQKSKTEIRDRVASYNDLPLTVKIKTSGQDYKIPKSVSLKDLLQDKEQKVLDLDHLPKTAFSKDELLETWTKYAYSIKSSDLDFFSTLNSCSPILKENFTVEITLSSSFQVAEFLKMKQNLLDNLRKKLNNFSINIVEILNVKEVKDIAVTPNDKYKKLVEKNALLEELRKKLDLGF